MITLLGDSGGGGSMATESAFTLKGYNDKPKPCLKKGCTGEVCPTWNANVGVCNKCKSRVSWSDYEE